MQTLFEVDDRWGIKAKSYFILITISKEQTASFTEIESFKWLKSFNPPEKKVRPSKILNDILNELKPPFIQV